MRRTSIALFALVTIALSATQCKKAIQNAQEDAIVKIITNNIWVVTSYREGSADMTSLFNPYEFKFNNDNTVLGKKLGAPDASGTWKGSAETLTITASFPNGPAPLDKLTGVWGITNTTLTSVKSSRVQGGVTYYLDLQAK